MESVEEKIRNQVTGLLFKFIWICLAADIFFLIYYLFTEGPDGLSHPLPVYILKRIALPTIVDTAAYLTARLFEKSAASNKKKNYVSTFCMCTLAGSIAIFNCYFVPLWCAPGTALVYCSIFHDKKLQNRLLVYCLLLTAGACLYAVTEYPDKTNELLQNAVVVLLMTVLFRVLGSVIERYDREMMAIQIESYRKEQEYKKLLSFDSLTGVYSRAYLVSRIKLILSGESELKKNTGDMVLAVIDVDNFKSVNDTYGHENGDVVLRTLGEVLSSVIERDDIAGRFGGEEFVIFLTRADYKKHIETLESLRESFMSKKYSFGNRTVTFSCGAVQCRIGDDFDAMFEKADEALYKAKNSGKEKNKVVESI